MMLEPVRDIIGTAHITVLKQLSPRKIAPSTLKLTLTQTLTLTSGHFSSRAIVWFPPTLKLTLTLTQTPTLTGVGNFPRGVIVLIPHITLFFCDFIKCAIFLLQ